MRKRSSWDGPRVNAGSKPAEPTKVVRLPVSIAVVPRRMAGRSFCAGDAQAFLNVEARTSAAVPFATGSVACGFPSPADGYLEHPLNFNELMDADAPSVFAVRVAGDSMIGAASTPATSPLRRRQAHGRQDHRQRLMRAPGGAVHTLSIMP